MKNKNLEDRLVAFASSIIEHCEELPDGFTNNHLRKQLIRSATSAALNYGEAQAGESRADFIHKLRVALKELKESFVCLKLLRNRPSLSSFNFSEVFNENNELIAIFIASINTASGGLRRK